MTQIVRMMLIVTMVGLAAMPAFSAETPSYACTVAWREPGAGDSAPRMPCATQTPARCPPW